MSNNETIDAILSSLREQVIAARTGKDRKCIYTDMDGPFPSKYGGKVDVGAGDEDGSTLYLYSGNASMNINCQPADLYTIAAHCIAAAMEVEEAQAEAQAVRPNMTAR